MCKRFHDTINNTKDKLSPLHPFHLTKCLQVRLPLCRIQTASTKSRVLKVNCIGIYQKIKINFYTYHVIWIPEKSVDYLGSVRATIEIDPTSATPIWTAIIARSNLLSAKKCLKMCLFWFTSNEPVIAQRFYVLEVTIKLSYT